MVSLFTSHAVIGYAVGFNGYSTRRQLFGEEAEKGKRNVCKAFFFLRYDKHNSVLGRREKNYSRLAWVSLDKNNGLNTALPCVILIVNALVIAILIFSGVVIGVLAMILIGVFRLVITITDF